MTRGVLLRLLSCKYRHDAKDRSCLVQVPMMAFSAPTTLALNSFSFFAALIIGASETLENHDISMALLELHTGEMSPSALAWRSKGQWMVHRLRWMRAGK